MINRRTVVRGAAWTAPVLAVAAVAPAYAVSSPLLCAPTAVCKDPGKGSHTKDYEIRTNCTSSNGSIAKVEVRDDKRRVWVDATFQPGSGTWIARGFNDSRRDRLVRITDTPSPDGTFNVQTFAVAFPPC